MAGSFNRDTIVHSLEELGRRLELAGVRAELYIVGGAAMALAFARDRVTRDIDAVFVPKTRVYDEAKAMALEDDTLGPDWLNDAVKGFLPSIEDSEAQVILEGPGIRVLVASPRFGHRIRGARKLWTGPREQRTARTHSPQLRSLPGPSHRPQA